MADEKPIVIIQKKGGHGGHHGGAWKIAYADFVTAMMAFFMVMWLVNSASVQTKQSIASYFKKPGLFSEGSGTPLMIGGAGILDDAFVPPRPEEKTKQKVEKFNPKPVYPKESGTGLDKKYADEGSIAANKGRGPDYDRGYATKARSPLDATFNDEAKKLTQAGAGEKAEKAAEKAGEAKEAVEKLIALPELKEILGKLEVKAELGVLTIEVMDTDKISMFNSGSAVIKPDAEAAFKKIAETIRAYPYPLEVVGHTDATPFSSRTGSYTNWELSSDRANAARRVLQREGVVAERFKSVIGKASSELRNPENPMAAENRRITLRMDFTSDTVGDENAKAAEPTPTATATATPTQTPTLEKNSKDGPDKPPSSAISPEEEEALRAAGLPTPVPTATPTLAPTKEAIPGAIKLPDGPQPTENPEFMERDKIFKDSPVVGKSEIFSGL